MKIVKANNKTKLILSKKEWKEIGIKNKWNKTIKVAKMQETDWPKFEYYCEHPEELPTTPSDLLNGEERDLVLYMLRVPFINVDQTGIALMRKGWAKPNEMFHGKISLIPNAKEKLKEYGLLSENTYAELDDDRLIKEAGFKDEKRVTRENCETRPAAKTSLCVKCKKPFILDKQKGWGATPVIVEDIKEGWFRGEDMVNYYHPECFESELQIK